MNDVELCKYLQGFANGATWAIQRPQGEWDDMNGDGMTISINGPGKSAKRPTLKWYWDLLGFGLLGYGAFVLLLPVWDSIGVETIRCEIRTAKPDSSSGGSRGSASTAGVLVETSNCGSIYVSPGVTFDNQDQVAASFKAGTEYEFDIGWFSRVVTKDIRHGIPSVQDYRLVD